MRRVTFSAVVWLTALWVMLWNDISIANLASGLVLSVVLLAANRLPFAAGATSGNDDRLRISPLHLGTSSSTSWCSSFGQICPWLAKSSPEPTW